MGVTNSKFIDLVADAQLIQSQSSPEVLNKYLQVAGEHTASALTLLDATYRTFGEQGVVAKFGTPRCSSFSAILLCVMNATKFTAKSIQATGTAFQFLSHYAYVHKRHAFALSDSGIWAAFSHNFEFMIKLTSSIEQHPERDKICTEYCVPVISCLQNMLMHMPTEKLQQYLLIGNLEKLLTGVFDIFKWNYALMMSIAHTLAMISLHRLSAPTSTITLISDILKSPNSPRLEFEFKPKELEYGWKSDTPEIREFAAFIISRCVLSSSIADWKEYAIKVIPLFRAFPDNSRAAGYGKSALETLKAHCGAEFPAEKPQSSQGSEKSTEDIARSEMTHACVGYLYEHFVAGMGFEEEVVVKLFGRLRKLEMLELEYLANAELLIDMLAQIQSEIVADRPRKELEEKLNSLLRLTVDFGISPPPSSEDDLKTRVKALKEFKKVNDLRRLFAGMLGIQIPLIVERENVVDSTFVQLVNLDKDFLRTLSVNFIGSEGEPEDGLDLGGLTKEYLFFVAEELTSRVLLENPRLGQWKTIIASFHDKLCGFPIPEADENFYLAYGRIVGLALYSGFQVTLPVNICLLKAALGQPLTGEDVNFLWEKFTDTVALPTINLDAADLELYFARQVGEESYPLIPNGYDVPVTNDNKLEFLQLLTKNMLGSSSIPAVRAFATGLRDVIPEQLLTFSAEELLEMLHGSQVNVSDLQAHTKVQVSAELNASQKPRVEQVVAWFWEILASSSDTEQSEVLGFVTGLRRVPIGGASDLSPKFTISIDLSLTGEHLPVAHTCSNELVLPVYPSKAVLKSKLQQAVVVNSFNIK